MRSPVITSQESLSPYDSDPDQYHYWITGDFETVLGVRGSGGN